MDDVMYKSIALGFAFFTVATILGALWAVIGLFVTLFALLGVNMFLSGLHSYGEL